MNKNLERLKGFLMEVKKDKSCEDFIDITSIINSIPYDSALKYDDELKELFELAKSVNNRYFEALCLWFERNNRHIDHYNHWLENNFYRYFIDINLVDCLNNISESGLKAVNVLYSMMIKDSIIDDTKYIQKFKDIIRESKTVKIENDKVLIKKENEKMESNVNLEEIIIDSLINDINHDLLDIVLTYYFDLSKDQREIIENINNITPEQEGNFRGFDNRKLIVLVKKAVNSGITPEEMFSIKFDLFVKSNSRNYTEVINNIFRKNPMVFPDTIDTEAFLIGYTRNLTSDLKRFKLPYNIFEKMVKELEAKPYLSAYLKLTKLMCIGKNHLIEKIANNIESLKEDELFIYLIEKSCSFNELYDLSEKTIFNISLITNQADDSTTVVIGDKCVGVFGSKGYFDRLCQLNKIPYREVYNSMGFDKSKFTFKESPSNSVSIVPVGFVNGSFVFKEIPVGCSATATVKLQRDDVFKSQSMKALEIVKEQKDPTYLALKESLDKTKKEANKNYIKKIVSEYNKVVKLGSTNSQGLISFIEKDQLIKGYSATDMIILDIEKFRTIFLDKLINWSKENYKEVYDLIENIKIINSKIEKDNKTTLSTNTLLLYSYVLELYTRIGYFDKDVDDLFYEYVMLIRCFSGVESKTAEDFINNFDKAYNNFLETNLK